MKELLIKKVENAYGIKKLRVNIENDKKLFQELIYSKNGTFKTSFSRMLYQLNAGNKDAICDRLTNEPSKIDISILDNNTEEKDLTKKFVIFSREIYDNSTRKLTEYEDELETLMLDKEDSEYIYELLSGDTEEIRGMIDIYLKGTSIHFDDLLERYTDDNKGYLDRVIELLECIISTKDQDISEINIKKLMQKPYDIIDDREFQNKIDSYINVLSKKINLELFDDKFNEENITSFITNLSKSNYLSVDKERGISIKQKVYYDIDEVKKIFDDEILRISKDPEVIEKSKEVSKMLGTSQEAIKLKKDFSSNPLLIKQLSLGRNEIIKIHLKHSEINFEYWLDIAKNTKKELERVFKKAKLKKTKFENAIKIYVNRFRPVFDIKIINKEESLLGLEVPAISFYHKRNKDKEVEEETLNSILSSGEKTTLNILKFIVEYEAIKQTQPFIILDDIVETFDYSNRYGFIEYINDLFQKNVPIIVLTHNFEFYKTLGSRVSIRKSIAHANDEGIVDLSVDHRINYDIEKVLKCKTKDDFFGAIAYLREAKIILGYNVDILNACLHYQKDTPTIQIKDIIKLFPQPLNVNFDEEALYLDELYTAAKTIKKIDNFDIIKKTILAISCRLLLEQKIIQKDFKIIKDVTSNQTRYLLDNYSNKLEDEVVLCLNDVLLLTPEFIHGNAFMYEPLIDIDAKYLEELYGRILELNERKIWKQQK